MPVKRPSGFTLIITATVLSGASGYAITWLVPRQIDLASYAVFAVFWSFLYLVVGTLSGIQQEVARATHPRAAGDARRGRTALNFSVAAAGIIFVIIAGSASLWIGSVFPVAQWGLLWPLAVGTSSYVFVAVVCGLLYGVAGWTPLAWMIVVDSVVRLVFVASLLPFSHDVILLGWAVAIPLPLTVLVLWPVVGRRVAGAGLNVSYSALTWNVARLLLAATALGLMVSGFPLVFGLAAHGESRSTIGLLILVITLTRAPLIVTVISMQSYLIVRFRDYAEEFWRTFFGLQTLVAAGAGILAALGWMWGPGLFAWLFPGKPMVEGSLFAVLVGSSALVASLCIAGAAVLARAQHFVYTTGWVVAALITVAVLALPMEVIPRVVLALLIGPIAGLIVHCGYLAFSRRSVQSIQA